MKNKNKKILKTHNPNSNLIYSTLLSTNKTKKQVNN